MSLLYAQFPPQFKLLNSRYNIRMVYFDPTTGRAGRSREANRRWRWKDGGTVAVRDLLRDGGDSA
jgi:hypothetical protein